MKDATNRCCLSRVYAEELRARSVDSYDSTDVARYFWNGILANGHQDGSVSLVENRYGSYRNSQGLKRVAF